MGYLEQAGASVYTTRERDLSDRMYLLDDGESGYIEDGPDFEDGLAGFSRRTPGHTGSTRLWGGTVGFETMGLPWWSD